jgi:hypothetical protein
MAVLAALAITILVKIGPAHYSASAFSPAVNVAVIRASALNSGLSSGWAGICSSQPRPPWSSCFPLWGILFPSAYTLMNLLPFLAFGWLAIGVVVAIVLRARRPTTLQALGRSFPPAETSQQLDPAVEGGST